MLISQPFPHHSLPTLHYTSQCFRTSLQRVSWKDVSHEDTYDILNVQGCRTHFCILLEWIAWCFGANGDTFWWTTHQFLGKALWVISHACFQLFRVQTLGWLWQSLFRWLTWFLDSKVRFFFERKDILDCELLSFSWSKECSFSLIRPPHLILQKLFSACFCSFKRVLILEVN